MTEVDVTEVAEVTEFDAAEESAPREPVYIDRPIQTVGRRKEAVVRVRLVPGTGKFNLDGRSLEDYFPNKVHQQLIKAPLVTVDRVDTVDIYAHLDGGGPSGQAGALRLAIARALMKHADLYIFDDSFSALDFKTDAALRHALQDETRDAAVLIIAQRISTILHADQIVVLKDGEVVGLGTHGELMETCEVYRAIAESQMKGGE